MRPLALRLATAAVLLLVAALPSRSEDSTAAGAPPASLGWKVQSPGWFAPRPAARITAGEGTLSGEVTLKPGSGLSFDRTTDWDVSSLAVTLSFLVDRCNETSRDYREGDARFPVSVTLVFGKDGPDLPWKKRFLRFFGNLWSGFPPAGIRLTYAWGCKAPAGSMFRLAEEETVFVLAGADEAGKRIVTERSPLSDFRAAYGRDPRGPVTRATVRFDRPSDEKGDAVISLEFRHPR